MKLYTKAALAVLLAAAALPAVAEPLKFGVLSDVDSLPYLVARDEGLYQANGVDVKLVSFTSPVERDAAFQAGAVDGVIGDVLGATLAWRSAGRRIPSSITSSTGSSPAPGSPRPTSS
jgi:NitT/TauT family transport system substrate-binding protein